MVGGVFRLFVYAIAAIAIIFVFMNYIWPGLAQEQPVEIMERNLERAMLYEGKYVSEKIIFSEGYVLKSRALESDTLSVIFKCNSPNVCCHDLQKCPVGEDCYEETPSCRIKLEGDKISVIKNGEAKVSFRCSSMAGLTECKIYFGDAPAQLEIENLEMKENFNIDEEGVEFSFDVVNSGNVDARFVGVKVEVYKVVEVSGNETEQFYLEKNLEEVAEIEKGGSESYGVELEMGDVGSFVVYVRAVAVDAGFDEKGKEFSVQGTAITPGCEATFAGEPELEEAMCVTKHYCSGCKFAFECKLMWDRKEVTGLELGTLEYAIGKKAPIMGECN